MARAKDLEFLRVLIAAAWADGEISYQELNSIRRQFRRLELTDDELTALEPYLADPIPPEEARGIIHDFLTTSSRSDRRAASEAIRDMLRADGQVEADEQEFLELFSELDADRSGADAFVARIKRLWKSAGAAGPEAFRRSDLLDEFIRNRVLYQVKRQLLAQGGKVELDADAERDLRWVCTLGALLGHVAAADGEFAAEERERIAELLDRFGSLQRRDVDAIVAIVESEVLRHVSYFPFAREFNDIASREEREQVLDLLMAVAAADGNVDHAELEEIRKISKVLNLSHQDFIAAKSRLLGERSGRA